MWNSIVVTEQTTKPQIASFFMFQISAHIIFDAVILVQLHGPSVYFKCELINIKE